MDKSSNAQQIKILYKELLSDYIKHSRKELFKFAQEHSETEYSSGMLTSALRTLVADNEDYVCISRGFYKKLKPSEPHNSTNAKPNALIDTYIESLSDTLKKSTNITSNPFEIMNMAQQDKDAMLKIEYCINVISKTLEELQ